MYSWARVVLRVNLTTGAVSQMGALRYVPRLIGGLGVAWGELRSGTVEFDPQKLLMISVGPLTGTLASGVGHMGPGSCPRVIASLEPFQESDPDWSKSRSLWNGSSSTE